MLNVIWDNAVFYLLFIPIFIGCSFLLPLAPLAVGAAGVIWFVMKSRYDYVMLIFLLTLILANNKSPIFDGYESLRIIFIGGLLALSIILVFKNKGLDKRIFYFIPFFVVGLISSFFFSPTMIGSVFRVISYLILVISIFVFIKYLMESPEYQLYDQLLLIIGFTLIVSLIGGVLYPSVFLISGRLNGVLGNPNFLGLFCVFAYPYIDHFRVEGSTISERSILILKGILILCLFLTGSRNGYASFAIYIIGTVFIFRGFSGKSLAIALGLGAFIALVQLENLVSLFPFLGKLVRPETLETASGRGIVWPIAIAEIYRQPWLGGGFEYYSYYMANFAQRHGLKGVYWYGVWNSYLAILLDTGIAGLLSYFYFIYGVIRHSTRFLLVLPFLGMVIFTGMFEAWAVSSLNPITPLFLMFFAVISIHGSRYENTDTA